MKDTLIQFGGSVKALGDGKVGGYQVLFTTDQDPDLANDFFQKDTDFATEFPGKSTVYYNHGLDKKLGLKKIGGVPQKGEMKMDDVGIWVETQLDMRDDYEAAIYKMAEEGKLGWSSGTAKHLVQRTKVGNAFKITSWPLGLDASLTPTPCEPRTSVMALKSWTDQVAEHTKSVKPDDSKPAAKGEFLGEYIEESMAMGAIGRANDALFYWVIWDTIYNDALSVAEKLAIVQGACGEFTQLVLDTLGTMLANDEGEVDDTAMKVLREHFADPKLMSVASKGLMSDTKQAAGALLSCAKRWSGRIEQREQQGMKTGRVLSESNAKAITESHAAMGTAVATLEEAMTSMKLVLDRAGISDVTTDDSEEVKLFINFQRAIAGTNGVQV